MSFTEIKDRPLVWLDASGPSPDIVVSSRVRLARNLPGRRFTHAATEADLKAIREEVAQKLGDRPSFATGCALALHDCTPEQRRCLLEKHLASPDLLRKPRERGLMLSEDLSRVVMINEEDHLRIQLFQSGFDPIGVCHAGLALDAELEEVLEFAFGEDFGYLTACPTNVGTGFRLSVLIHLPGLVLSGEIEKILNSLRQLQFTVRGLYGEGSAVRGALFQISNLGTLGRSEETLTSDFARRVAKVIQYELRARQNLLEKDSAGIHDMACRSHGILRNAHLITAQEAFDRLSHVRMGVSLGILPEISLALLNRALVWMQAAHIQVRAGQLIKGRKRTAARADYFRELFA